MKKYTHTSLGKGHESEPFVYKEEGKENIVGFHKEYTNQDYDDQPLEKDDIIFDHALHHLLSQEEGIVKTQPFVLGKKKYKGLKIRVLDKDPHKIHIATNLLTKEQIYCTHPTYVSGKTLGEFKDTYYDWNGMRCYTYIELQSKIETYITAFVANKTEEVLGYPLHILQLNEVNIKVIHTSDDEYLQVIITDLFAQYNWFVHQNEQVIDQAKCDLCKLFEVNV